MNLSAVQTRLRRHWLALLLALLSLALASGGDAVTHALRYERELIADGQWWRLLSGNLVHLGWPHLWLNLAGLALIWLLFQPELSARAWSLALLISALSVGLGLWWFNPELDWYVGLSGALHGLFAAGALVALRGARFSDYLLGIVLAVKLIWEQVYGALPSSAEAAGGAVIVDAHLYGALGGAVVGLLIMLYQRHRAMR